VPADLDGGGAAGQPTDQANPNQSLGVECEPHIKERMNVQCPKASLAL
jgi:hypothetical protein